MIKEISQKNSVKKRVNLYLILSTIVSLAIIIFLCGYWFLGDFGFLNRILSQPAPANKINLAENYSSTSPLRKETSGFREDEQKIGIYIAIQSINSLSDIPKHGRERVM